MLTSTPSPVLLLDVDGVLTDRHACPNDDVLNSVVEFARRKWHVALITGRSRSWLARTILPRFPSDDSTALESLMFVGEHGLIRGWGVDTSEWTVDEDKRLPDPLRLELRSSVERSWAHEIVEWDATKECVATFELRHEIASSLSRDVATQALDEVLGICQRTVDNLAPRPEVLKATYAVDVIPKGISKAGAAKWVLNVIKQDRCCEVHVFGDSPGDAVMVQGCHDAGFKRVTFYWLGEGAPPEVHSSEFVQPPRSYDQGARWALEKLKVS